jgi:beta-glucosidase
MKTLQIIKSSAALAMSSVLSIAAVAADSPANGAPEIWKDRSAPIEARVKDLVGRLTLEEKITQMRCDTAPIPRLGIPAYSHRNECLHGIANGPATVFPQAIGMAATWDTALIRQEADAIATEARAIHNDFAAKHGGASARRFGLTYYSPNINIFRDPRWGRGQETYGEDPFLTGQMAVAFIRGLQGNDPKYVKIMAGAKHFAAHSGPEPGRHKMDATPSERDLYESYLPAFEAAVRDGHVGSIMAAYSSLNGMPDCADPFLLTDLLRKSWGFNGFVVSDGGAIWDIWAQHKYVPTAEAAAAAAVKAGCDLCSGNSGATEAEMRRGNDWTTDARGWWTGGEDFNCLTNAFRQGLITEKELDPAVSRELAARFRVGLFDPPEMVPFSKISLADNDTPEHRELALKVARESIVLLKNEGVLPLDRSKIKRIAVIGPNAASTNMLLGNYHGTASHPVTILDGIRDAAGKTIDVVYKHAVPMALRDDSQNAATPEGLAQAIGAADSADVVIYVGGIDSSLEKEEDNNVKVTFDGFNRGDRTRIELPSVQTDLLKQLAASGKPVIFVNCSGSAMAMPWETKNLPAILQAWYPGEEGGRAVAEVLFGDVNPSGRLPVTFYNSTEELPWFEDYSMNNRTYRYFRGKSEFAFGHGLSYSKFDYGDLHLDAKEYGAQDTIKVSFTLRNSGPRDGGDVAQIYFRHVHSAVPQPRLALCGFARVEIPADVTAHLTVNLPVQRFRSWYATSHHYVVEPGRYELLVGRASDDIVLRSEVKIKE